MINKKTKTKTRMFTHKKTKTKTRTFTHKKTKTLKVVDNKTIGDEGITVVFWIIKVHTSN